MEYTNSKIKKFYSLFLTWSFFSFFFPFFSRFCFWEIKYTLVYLVCDTTEMIFPFFPFLFWGNGGQIRNTLMWYYRNGFSLFFPFSVFPSKSFFLFFFYFFCSGYFVHISCHSNTKIFKNVFFWRKKGKREKIDKKFKKHLCFLL